MSGREFAIAGRSIGPDHPPYVIAEVSANHNGSLDRALSIIKAASVAGADAVKLQTYTADTMTIDSPLPDFQIDDGLWKGRNLYDLYNEAHTPWAWHEELFARGRDLGITIFSTPFDATAVDFLETLGAPAYKIASFELVDLNLIEHVARTGKPIIMSTGMGTLEEIGEAVETVRGTSASPLVLLHCVSAYPAPPEQAKLGSILELTERFGCTVGLSDHTLGTTIAAAAVALGACVVEKHFTLRRADGGPDGSFSLEPDELARLVEDCGATWRALGSMNFDNRETESQSMIFRRSLYVVAEIKSGETLTPDNTRIIRPGYGLAPKHYKNVLGRTAARDISRGTALQWDLLG